VAPGRERLRIEDVRVPGLDGNPDVTVRVYRPTTPGAVAGGIVQFHGGGFVAGDLDSEDERSVQYAADAGLVVVSVDYRLAPEDPFPAAAEDGYAALCWTSANATALGIDPTRLGVGGTSAGGTLAAATALRARNEGGPSLAFQFLLFPALDDRLTTRSQTFVGTPFVDGSSSRRLWECYCPGDRRDLSPYAAPARASDLSSLPPAYIVTAELDPLRDEGLDYARRLLEAGVPVDVRNYSGTFHAFDTIASAISTHAQRDQTAWLRRRVEHESMST
jgi:acetyl esterase/lipase